MTTAPPSSGEPKLGAVTNPAFLDLRSQSLFPTLSNPGKEQERDQGNEVVFLMRDIRLLSYPVGISSKTHDIPYDKPLHYQTVILTKVVSECFVGVIFPPDSFRKFRRWSRLLPWQQRTLLYSARILKIEAKRNHYFKKECETELVVRLVHFRRKNFHVIIAVVSATSAWTRFEQRSN